MSSSRAEQVWKRVRDALEPHAPAAITVLNPGAAAETIRSLEQTIGAPLPSELAESLRVHDGQRAPPMAHTLFDAESLLSAEGIAQAWKLRKDVLADLGEPAAGVEGVWWDERYLPVTESEGNGFCVDLNSGAVYYHVHDDVMDGPLFPSWYALLEALAEKVEAGEFELEGRGVWVELDDESD